MMAKNAKAAQVVEARYPISIGDTLIPAGERGTTVFIGDDEAKHIKDFYPWLSHEAGGDLWLVKFPSHPKVFLAANMQITVVIQTTQG